MKKIALLFILFTCLIGFGQEHSGGIVVPTGFKIAANAPVDDRFVVADSLSLYDLPNKYDGMFAVTLDEEKRVIWTYNEGEGVWSRAVSSSKNDYSVTKAELDSLIATESLIPNALYEITGVNPDLYGGTTIYLKAVSTSELNPRGVGKFFNPKYNKEVNGFGVYNNENEYNIDDIVIWGGKHWKNLTGKTGSYEDDFTLNAEDWEVIPYNEIDYNVAFDEIVYDVKNDYIVERSEANSNVVRFSYDWLELQSYDSGETLEWLNPIRRFQWGNHFEYNEDDYEYKGLVNNLVENAWFNCINFSYDYLIDCWITGYYWVDADNDYWGYKKGFLGSGYVEGWNIANNAVTNAKIANGTITTDKIANNAVTNDKIVNATISKEKLSFDLANEVMTWNHATAVEQKNWKSVTYGNGKFVAVSDFSSDPVIYSFDGITWNSATGASGVNLRSSICYGNGKFVVVTTSGTNRVMYSSDGITWNSTTAAEQNEWSSVTYGNGKFVAVAANGTNRVMYSLDGITWNSAKASEQNAWRSVTYGNGKFVAVSSSGTNRVMYSLDGITWNSSTAAEQNSWWSVTYGNGKFVAVNFDISNRVMYSSDGITWNSVTVPSLVQMNSVTYGNGKFVAVSSYGTNKVMWSLDGITWNSTVAAEQNSWRSVTYGNGKFVAVASNGDNRVMYAFNETKTSELVNDGDGDSPFITKAEADLKYVESDELGAVALSNDYNDLDNKPTIPAQVNLIEGSNISITGTYPNLTISASGTVGADWEDIGGDQSTVNLSGFTNDAGFITEVTEGDVTQYESSLTITESQISDLGDYLESGDNISELVNDVGYTTNTGTVTSVGVSVPTGLEVSGSPVTTSGTIDITYASGYQGYTTAEASKLSGIESGAQVNVPTNLAQGTRTSTTVPITSSTGTSATLEVATTTLAGVMSASDKAKLDGIEAGAQVNVNADWNAVSGDAQILNKPTIPTKTSQLENDSGFVTSSGVTSVSGTANQIVSTGGDTPTLSLHSDILASIELANTAIQSADLATVATTGDYNDLDNLPTIPAPQSLDDVLGVGNSSERSIVLSDGVQKTITYSGESIVYDYKGKSITVEFEPDNNYTHTLPNRNGTYAMLDDIPSLSGYATEAYVANYKRPVNRVSTGAVLSISLPESRFIFTGTSTQTFKVLSPTSGLDGVKIDFYNPTDYNVAVEVYTVGDEIMDLTSNSIVTSVTIGPKSGGEFFCDYNNDLWYYNKK